MTADSADGHAPHSGSVPGGAQAHTGPHTGAQAVVADAAARTGVHSIVAASADPARRPDVLFRVRGGEDHQPSVWWMIGAFVLVSGAAIVLLSFVPGGS